MSSECLPIIVLIGLDTKNFELIDSFIGSKYLLYPVDQVDSMELIGFPQNVILFMVDTDNPLIRRDLIIEKIKTTEFFENIPIIGLSLKQHYAEMTKDDKWNFNDILLMPCGTEDMLTRIDIWIKTYETICNETGGKSFSLEPLE
ncbi:hypothetical protein NEF87_004977 [Candidatus Lokiarchaeum ossiferum]|uniref:Uncharacterized protein n=1 Tax=Candidatus Lokiarchaeum ossiferum TaxID=2951803 RepID=A0ABY6HYU1_9ARCH|nr:hypothetical protein NEF87_004977 [Candidatus Lokiarchaeum sp. B-35]